MSKKITRFAFVAALMAASSVHAQNFFYAGPKVGLGISGGSLGIENLAASKSTFKGTGATSYIAGLGGGYVIALDHFLMGLDLGLLYNSLNNKLFTNLNASKGVTVKLKNNFLYQVAFRFGFELCNKSVPFITLGAAGGSYKLSFENTTAAAIFGIPAGAKETVSKKTIGFMPGVGVLIPVTDNLIASFEYNVTFGKKLSKNFTDGTRYLFSKSVVQHALLLGMNWKF